MATLPAAGYLSDNARDQGEMKTGIEAVRDVVAQVPGGNGPSALTISSDTATPNRNRHTLNSENLGAPDNLDTLAITNLPEGSYLSVSIADESEPITVIHGGGTDGQIFLIGDFNVEMTSLSQELHLVRRANDWHEIGRSGRERVKEIGVYGPTYQGGWAAAGNGLFLWKDHENQVRIEGHASHSGDPGTSSSVFALPSLYRPSVNLSFHAWAQDSGGTWHRVRIEAASGGIVACKDDDNLIATTVDWLHFAGIVYRAEA